jgi:putative FmdB family regulatory protein
MGELFIYKCTDCGQEFELYHLISEPVHEIKCPECGGTEAVRMFSHEHKGALPNVKDIKTEEEEE